MNSYPAMTTLARTFPGLRSAPGVDPFEQSKLEQWACGPAPGRGAFHAAAFVLSVFNPQARWRCGRFELHRALQVWDDEHLAAFVAWAREPWWP